MKVFIKKTWRRIQTSHQSPIQMSSVILFSPFVYLSQSLLPPLSLYLDLLHFSVCVQLSVYMCMCCKPKIKENSIFSISVSFLFIFPLSIRESLLLCIYRVYIYGVGSSLSCDVFPFSFFKNKKENMIRRGWVRGYT